MSALSWLTRPWSIGKPAQRDSPAKPFGHLVPGRRYRVIRSFVDHDRTNHPIGERWTFLRSSFLPYEDGLSLFTAVPEGAERQIRLQMRPEAQGDIASMLYQYIVPEADRPDRHAMILTRDSVCLADDIAAPHAASIEVGAADDAAGVAKAILSTGCLTGPGQSTWAFALGSDRIVFGWRWTGRFIQPVDPETFSVRADEIGSVHVFYHMQADPADVVAALRRAPGRVGRLPGA